MKKTMKALLILSLIAALLLCGCGGEDPKGNVTPNETTPAGEPLSLGSMDGGVYTNTYAGLRCTLDESWTFYSAEELQEIPDAVKDLAEGTDIAEMMENVEQYTDMMAENAEMVCSMNIQMTKLDLVSRLAYMAMSEQELMDGMMEEKDSLISTYEQMGISVSTMELRKVTFAGQERVSLYTAGETSGVPVYMTQLMDYKRGGYGVTLTLTSFLEDNSGTMLALFEVVE